MNEGNGALWGIVIYEFEKRYYYHTVRADKYERVKESMARLSINVLTGRNNLDDMKINDYLLRARRFIIKSEQSLDDSFLNELKEF